MTAKRARGPVVRQTFIVYELVNRAGDVVYVGSTTAIQPRLLDHRRKTWWQYVDHTRVPAPTSLTVQSKIWPTPRASDGDRGTDPKRTNDRAGSPTFKAVATEWDGLLAPATPTDGESGSPRADLNPSFVAALMGLPWDWLTSCTSEATASSLSVPQRHGASLRNAGGGNCE